MAKMYFSKYFQVKVGERGKDISFQSWKIRVPRLVGGYRPGRRMLIVLVRIYSY
jgi:hypothetical protein